VLVFDLGVNDADVGDEAFIAYARWCAGRSRAGQLPAPLAVIVITAGADAEYLARNRNRVAPLMRFNPGVLHSFNLVCEHGALPLSLFRGGLGPLGCRAPSWQSLILVQARGYGADRA